MTSGISYSPGSRVGPLPPEPYKLSKPGIYEKEGRQFIGTHNLKKEDLFSNHFQRVRATKEEFEGIANGYTAFFDIVKEDGTEIKEGEDYKGPCTARLKPGQELNFHEVFNREANEHLKIKDGDKSSIKKAKEFLSGKISNIFQKNDAKLSITKEALASGEAGGLGRNKFTIKAGNSQPVGDHVEVDQRSATDKSKVWKLMAGIGLTIVAVPTLVFFWPVVSTALAAIPLVGLIGGTAATLFLGKTLLPRLKSPWWGKTAEGQIQKLARKQSKALGQHFSTMVRNQMALDHSKTKLVGNPVQAQAPALCEPEKLENFLLLAKTKGPEALKSEIREFLLNKDESFLDDSTIDRAKGGVGWFFAGGKKAHAEKTVEIVTEEIYKGIIRGLGEGYLNLLEAAVADVKTTEAQGVFTEKILPPVDDFGNAMGAFKNSELNSNVNGGASSAFEIYETDERLTQLESYQKKVNYNIDLLEGRAINKANLSADDGKLLEEAEGKNLADIDKEKLGEANLLAYKEILTGFKQDVDTHIKSIKTVQSLVKGSSEGEASLETIQDGVIDLFSKESLRAEEITELKQKNLEALSEIEKKIDTYSGSPDLLEVHYRPLKKLVGDLKQAIQDSASAAETLAMVREDLRSNSPDEMKISAHLDRINAHSLQNLFPLSPSDSAREIFHNAVDKKDQLVRQLSDIQKLYSEQEPLTKDIQSQIIKAGDNFSEAFNKSHKEILSKLDEQTETLKDWNKNYKKPSGLDPAEKKNLYLRDMAGAAAGIPEADRNSLEKTLLKLCKRQNTAILTSLKGAPAESKISKLRAIEELLPKENEDRQITRQNSLKAFEVAQSIYPEDRRKALSLAQALFTDQSNVLTKYDETASTVDNLRQLFGGEVGTQLYGWANWEDPNIEKPATFEITSFLNLIAKFQTSIGQDATAAKGLAKSLEGINDGTSLIENHQILDSIGSRDLGEISTLSQKLGGQLSDEKARRSEFQALSDAILGHFNDGVERQEKLDVQKLVAQAAQVKTEKRQYQEEIVSNLQQVVQLTSNVGKALSCANYDSKKATEYLARVFGTDVATINKAVQNHKETAHAVRQFLHAYQAFNLIEQEGGIPGGRKPGFTRVELEKGIKTLGAFPRSIVPEQSATAFQFQDYTQFKKRLEERNKAVDAASKLGGSPTENQVNGFLKKYGTVLQNFLYEQKAYEALLGAEPSPDDRIALEQISPNPLGRDNSTIVRNELLLSSRINAVHLQLQKNVEKELTSAKVLSQQNTDSEFLSNHIQHLQRNVIGDTESIQRNYENACFGDAVAIGKRLVESERMNGLESESIKPILQKEEFETLKAALKHINPKQMELQRPGIFMRMVNRILNRRTGIEKLMARVGDVQKAKEHLATLGKYGVETKKLQEQLDSLEVSLVRLQKERDELLQDSKGAHLGIRYLAAEHLSAKADPEARLSSDDIKSIKAKWSELVGEGNEKLWSDFDQLIPENTGLDELLTSLDVKERNVYQDKLTSYQKERTELDKKYQELRDELFEAHSTLFIPLKATDIEERSRQFLTERGNNWMKEANLTPEQAHNMPLNDLLLRMRDQITEGTEKASLKEAINGIWEVSYPLDTLYNQFRIFRKNDKAETYQNHLTDLLRTVSANKEQLRAKTDQIYKLTEISGYKSSSESVRGRLTGKNIQPGVNPPLNEISGLILKKLNKLEDLCRQELENLKDANDSTIAELDESDLVELQESVQDLASRFELSPELQAAILREFESNPDGLMQLQSQLLNAKTISEGQELIKTTVSS
jgi:hypothetical protein